MTRTRNTKFKNKTIRLCGVQGCCPTVTFKKGEVLIKDDFGGKVKLTKAQFAELQHVEENSTR